MQPARMQVQLHIVPGFGNPSRNAAHRFVAEIGGLQRLDEEGSLHPELGKAVEQKTEPMFLATGRPKHDGFRDRGQFRMLEIAADTEFGVDRDADFGGLAGLHNYARGMGLEPDTPAGLTRMSDVCSKRSECTT